MIDMKLTPEQSPATQLGLARVAAPATLFALSHEYTAHPLTWA